MQGVKYNELLATCIPNTQYLISQQLSKQQRKKNDDISLFIRYILK
ncbi:hypothetical protein ABIC84_000355 [Mucilaginibacter sp. 3215]